LGDTIISYLDGHVAVPLFLFNHKEIPEPDARRAPSAIWEFDPCTNVFRNIKMQKNAAFDMPRFVY